MRSYFRLLTDEPGVVDDLLKAKVLQDITVEYTEYWTRHVRLIRRTLSGNVNFQSLLDKIKARTNLSTLVGKEAPIFSNLSTLEKSRATLLNTLKSFLQCPLCDSTLKGVKLP